MKKLPSFRDIKELQNELPEGIKIFYHGNMLDESMFEMIKDERLPGGPDYAPEIALRKNNYRALAAAKLGESFNCCGKAHLFEFEGDKKPTITLLKVAKIIAKQLGYSYLGFTHVKGDSAIKAGYSTGFKCAVNFSNARSGNKLKEMYTLL